MGKDWEPIVTRKKGQDIIFLPECAQHGGDAEVTIEQFLKIFDKLVELEYIEPSNRTGTAGQKILTVLTAPTAQIGKQFLANPKFLFSEKRKRESRGRDA